ncbi:OmpH family outer membrane protein [Roseovarius arcticus]|uniref:OmpH family outer membrane protein n=1 Tax=Roseovarius arcticus TaxID=2547404 RepID=UPI0014868AA3|nr:OmpH family outer membrane protein [Roseovarius arcticus]
MRGAALTAALTLCHLQGAQAQDVGVVQSQILVLDPDRLFAESQVGQRLTDQYQSERDALIASNRELEAQLRGEEQALTASRSTMSATDFRAEADAFDARVRSIRTENERKARDLERGRELAPLALMRMAEPILIQVMRDTGGQIILDNRQVLLRADAIDITDLAIARVDETIGDGTDIGAEAAPIPDAPKSQDTAPEAGDTAD